MMTDEQVTEFCNSVAREAWRAMNDAVAQDREVSLYVSLYVYADGSWTIDGRQYLTDHRNIVAAVSITLVNGPTELADKASASALR